MMIEYVVVKGYNEESAAANSNSGDILDAWSESRHEVFRRIGQNANAAMQHFQVVFSIRNCR